jgi:hypothetical protein
MAVLQASSLYKAPSYMPGGYSLSSMDTFDGDSETIIRAVYRGPGQPIEIYRVRRYERPIDVYMPPSDAPTTIEAATLDGKPAIFSYPKPGSFLDGKGFTRASFLDGEVETTVMGFGLDLESAIRIAGSVGAGGPVSATATALPPDNDDGMSEDAGVNAPPPTATGLPVENHDDEGTSGQLGEQASGTGGAEADLIFEGIATDSALVYSWWHGAEYGQSALDLHAIPDDATPGADVYFTSRLSGPVGLLASVVYYPGRCTGVRVALVDAGLNTLGPVDYVHIQSTVSEGDWWWVPGGWSDQHLGTVLADETDACKNPPPPLPPGWTGPHLHQAIDTGYDQMIYNVNLQLILELLLGHPNVIDNTNRGPWGQFQFLFLAATIDADGDGVPDTSDNCPTTGNPGQENFDADGPPWGNGPGIGNGTGIPGNDATVPNGDGLGDACDPDIDNDGIPNGSDLYYPGGDNTYDDNNNGNPCHPLGSDTADNGPSWDHNCNGKRDGVESICPLATNPNGDDDGDGLLNTWEVCKWGTDPSYWDTDGDGLHGDCKEAMDVNGNGFVTAADATFIKQASFGVIGSDGDFDINGNGFITNADAVLVLQAVFGVSPCQ